MRKNCEKFKWEEEDGSDSEKRMKMNPKSIIDERIEVVTKKLMFYLKTEKGKMKDIYLRKKVTGGHQDNEKDEELQGRTYSIGFQLKSV